MTPGAPRIERSPAADGAGLRLSGDWSAARLAEPANWARLQADLSFAAPVDAAKLSWDLRGLQRLDHTGAHVLWNAWGHQWPPQLLIEPSQRAMLGRVAQYALAEPVARRSSAWLLFLALGAKVWLLI